MSERDSYSPGEFCWVDLATPDVAAAASFYGDVMGWEHVDSPDPEAYGGYGMFHFDGKVVAGIGPLVGEGQHPAWASYVSVEDAGEVQKKVEAAGGEVFMGDIEIPGGMGKMSVCRDAEGAFFCLWQPGVIKGAQLVNEPGSWTWNQLASRDLDKASAFYGEVFGWKNETSEEAPDDFQSWQADVQRWDEGIGGLMRIGDDMPDEVPPHWQVYFSVPSADEAIEKTKAGGGTLLFGPQEIPVGTIAVFKDPHGANFAVIEPDYPGPR